MLRLAAVTLGLATVLLTLASCGNQSPAADTPGYSARDRTIDTSPFELPGGSGTGQTTLPPQFFEAQESATPSTTTTTALEPVSSEGTGDALCDGMREFLQFSRTLRATTDLQRVKAITAESMPKIVVSIDRSSVPEVKPLSAAFAAMAADVERATTVDAALAILSGSRLLDQPENAAALEALNAHASTTCPSLLLTR